MVMAGIKTYFGGWRIALALVLGACIGSANAGPAEDYAAGMVSYQRTDFFVAVPLLRKAADAGHIEAAVVLATIYDGAEQDEQAVIYFRKAADAGSAEGMYGLGNMLAAGEGTTKDVVAAKALFVKAADAGHVTSVQLLAQAYLRGELGIPEEQRKGAEALKWITAAADLNFIPALEALQQAYLSGDYGLTVDPVKSEQIKQKIISLKPVPPKKRRRG